MKFMFSHKLNGIYSLVLRYIYIDPSFENYIGVLTIHHTEYGNIELGLEQSFKLNVENLP